MGHAKIPTRPASVPASEAAEILGVTSRTVRRWIEAGRVAGAWEERAAGRYGVRYMVPTRWIRAELRRRERGERT